MLAFVPAHPFDELLGRELLCPFVFGGGQRSSQVLGKGGGEVLCLPAGDPLAECPEGRLRGRHCLSRESRSARDSTPLRNAWSSIAGRSEATLFGVGLREQGGSMRGERPDNDSQRGPSAATASTRRLIRCITVYTTAASTLKYTGESAAYTSFGSFLADPAVVIR